MKTIHCLAICIFLFFSSHAQLLTGKWKGTYTLEYPGAKNNMYSPIELEFLNSNDTAYSVFSYSLGHSASKVHDHITCKVFYQLIAKDSIYLEEVEIAAPPDANPTMMKKMWLKISQKKRSTHLDGVWSAESDSWMVNGTMFLRRKN